MQWKHLAESIQLVMSWNMKMNALTSYLSTLLEGLFVGKAVRTKIASIRQAKMQAAQLRVLLAPHATISHASLC